MIKKIVYLIVLSAVLFSCKNEKKEPLIDVKQAIEEKAKEVKPKLPVNTIQLNDGPFVSNGFTLTKVHVQNSNDNNFLYKIFFSTDDIELYKNGDYSLFIQNFPYESDKINLEENFQKSGVASYWVNLKSAKPYKDEFVIIKSFKSKIYTFKKTTVGVMNLKEKTDVFRKDYYDTILVN